MPPDNDQLLESLKKLRQLTQVNLQAGWRFFAGDLSVSQLQEADAWQTVQLNEKGHIAWPPGRQVLWLVQRFVVPQHLYGYSLAGLALRLTLLWWAEEARIFVNGREVQQGDLFDCSVRISLSPAMQVGDEFTIALRLVSPGHDAGALVRSRLLCEATDPSCLDPSFVADELEALQNFISQRNPQYLPNDILSNSAEAVNRKNLNSFLDLIDWEALPDREKFERSLSKLRQVLLGREKLETAAQILPSLAIATEGKWQGCPRQIHLLGHAHLDLAWLWPVSETWEAAQRTFESVLKLQQEFQDLIFCHSTPALYEWIEEHRPDLFAAIQRQVVAGRWEIVGGTWIEPDLNLIAGESIVRQVLYGQRYAQAKFGEFMRVAWLPDTFGFCWQVPQIFRQGGIEFFVTQKLRWNDTTEFPHGVFQWQSPDGSQLFSLMSAPIGEGIDPVKMATYTCDWEKQTQLSDSLWLPGVGDHGGGPTREMLEVTRRWQQSPFFPELKFSKAVDYLSTIEGQLEGQLLPIWRDELYLEFHRGCYTSHADQKRWNRRCEVLLYEAELWASWATLMTGAAYPQSDLEKTWKEVLFNQFHDILPGSSIRQVYVDANQTWVDAEARGQAILDRALDAIATDLAFPTPPQLDAQPILILNSLNWLRSEVVAVPLPDASHSAWHVYDLSGKRLVTQRIAGDRLLFLAEEIPAVGYRVFWLCRQTTETLENSRVESDDPKKAIEPQITARIAEDEGTFSKLTVSTDLDWVLETDLIRAIVDGKTGNLSSIIDKVKQREILNSEGGNRLEVFQDSGQYWDAWNIDPKYADYPLTPPSVKEIVWQERGEVQQRLRVVRQIGKSEVCQDYIVQIESPLLKISTQVNWQEDHLLVKAAFGFNVEANWATYEMPCGAIERTTRPQTEAEKAKWEVPALRWADLSLGEFGVSLLNDCKYGYDAKPHQLRLTLLRGSTWPDEVADRGIHQFTYTLYSHGGSWQDAQTVQRGYELNVPLQVRVLPSVSDRQAGTLSPVGRLLDLSAENLILMAFKRSEDRTNEWILRCYECCGKKAELRLKSDWDVAIAHPTDLLEQPIAEISPNGDRDSFEIEPWKIVSFSVQLSQG